MSEWKKYKFAELAEFITEKIETSSITKEKYISTENMLPNLGGISVAEALPSVDRCNYFKNGDILFSNIRTYFKKVWLSEFDGGCSADVLVIRSKDESILLTSYLYLIICSDKFINFTIASSNGAKMPRGDKSAIKKYELSIPPLSKQKKHVDLYIDFNKKIQLNTQLNQTLEQIAQATFKSWFIDFEPVHAKATALADGQSPEQATFAAMTALSGKTPEQLHRLQTENPTAYNQLHTLAEAFPSEFEEVEGGIVPKGWETVSIADNKVLEILKPKIKPFNGEKDYIATANVSQNTVVGNLEKITYENRPSRANMQPIIDSIWFAKMVGEHKALMIDRNDEFMLEQTILSTGFLGVLPKQYKHCFIYCFINSEYFIQAKNQLATGAVQVALNNGAFSKVEIVLPSDEILKLFEEKMKSIYSKIAVKQRENKSLVKIRGLLLPKLLSKEIYLRGKK